MCMRCSYLAQKQRCSIPLQQADLRQWPCWAHTTHAPVGPGAMICGESTREIGQPKAYKSSTRSTGSQRITPLSPNWCARLLSMHGYLGGVSFAPVPDDKGGNDTGKLFNWHPILMTLAFGVFMAEAVLTYQAPLIPGVARPVRKKIHASLHSAALVSALVGVWFAYKSHTLKLPHPIPNFYSPHSWLGATTLALFGLQYVLGFSSYLWPQASLPVKLALGPIHKFIGKLVWVCGLAAMAAGLQEKSSFIQFGKGLTGSQLFSPLLRLPAVAQVLIVALGALVLYHHVPAARALEDDRDARQALLAGPSESNA